MVISSSCFVADCVQLKEDEELSGFLGKGNLQHFEIDVNGKQAPLAIKLQSTPGAVTAFVSFTVTRPSPALYHSKYSAGLIEISSALSMFTESKCFLGVQAEEDTHLAISCSFAPILRRKKLVPSSSVVLGKLTRIPRNLQDCTETSQTREALKVRVEQIKAKRTQHHRLNFVKANVLQVKPVNKSFIDRSQEVKLRKAQLYRQRIDTSNTAWFREIWKKHKHGANNRKVSYFTALSCF